VGEKGREYLSRMWKQNNAILGASRELIKVSKIKESKKIRKEKKSLVVRMWAKKGGNTSRMRKQNNYILAGSRELIKVSKKKNKKQNKTKQNKNKIYKKKRKEGKA
jgi:hypothetical protein